MSRSEKLEWNVNIDALYDNFHQVPSFDESLRYNGKHIYHLVGERSIQYDFELYQKIFPNITKEQVVVVEEAGHWVHFDKPKETVGLISQFLSQIDSD